MLASVGLPDCCGRATDNSLLPWGIDSVTAQSVHTLGLARRDGGYVWFARLPTSGRESRRRTWPTWCCSATIAPAMLSRAQEARVRAILWSSPVETVQTYCLEHLATAAKIPPGHMSDLAVFVRGLHERGDCQRRFGGFCGADQHVTRQTLVWGPPARLGAQGLP